MRIVHSEAATSFGGQEGRIFKEMNAMRARGHHLEAICQPSALLAERLSDAGFTVHTLEMDGPLNYLKCVVAIRQILREGRFDVLNAHSQQSSLSTYRICATSCIS
ncbi:glycosyltransferase [Ectopseudomonas mendocina]|uniref:glycosyltransferase n=1 Tax=Ectopseudomonas mendocina TaxID=300 RepID=UPI0021B13636|nr:glycosyltransferase [Pseudomonas mendocina]